MALARQIVVTLTVVVAAFGFGWVYAGLIVAAKRDRRCKIHGRGHCLDCGYRLQIERPDDALAKRMERYWQTHYAQPAAPEPVHRMSPMFGAIAQRAMLVLLLWAAATTASYGQYLKCQPTKDALGESIFACYPDPAFSRPTTLGFPCPTVGLIVKLADGSCGKLSVIDPAATSTTGYVIAPDGGLRAVDNIATPAAWSLYGSGAVKLANYVARNYVRDEGRTYSLAEMRKMHTGDLPFPTCMPCESTCASKSCLQCHSYCPGDAARPRRLVRSTH